MKKIFIAGATGAVGYPLVQLLMEAGKYEVYGSTRNIDRASILRKMGVTPIIVDVYDAKMLKAELQKVKPDFVIHQLTDLPYGLPKDRMPDAQLKNARIRTEGTFNLIGAIGKIKLEGFLVQSIAFMYGEGHLPHLEAEPNGTETLRSFEKMAIDAQENSKIMRYGRFYGPKTGFDNLDLPCRVHVEAAAHACELLLNRGNGKVYNICEDSEYASNEKIILDTNWNPEFRLPYAGVVIA